VAAVYGCGNLGLLTVHILKRLFPGVQVIALAAFAHQADLARRFGADLALNARPAHRVIEEIAAHLGCEVHRLRPRQPWLIEGVDFVFDTVASAETLETGIRIVKARRRDTGVIVVTGVSAPRRFEWTPWYFKEVRILGSNAFAVEEFEGRRGHAYEHYFRLLQAGRVDPTPMLTHQFSLAEYREALTAAHYPQRSRAVKVLFAYPEPESPPMGGWKQCPVPQ
jgi:threonine dehydrogenase-like Zn-dependent dehydrogenase